MAETDARASTWKLMGTLDTLNGAAAQIDGAAHLVEESEAKVLLSAAVSLVHQAITAERAHRFPEVSEQTI